jgi:hypothetical protein
VFSGGSPLVNRQWSLMEIRSRGEDWAGKAPPPGFDQKRSGQQTNRCFVCHAPTSRLGSGAGARVSGRRRRVVGRGGGREFGENGFQTIRPDLVTLSRMQLSRLFIMPSNSLPSLSAVVHVEVAIFFRRPNGPGFR